MKDLQSFSTVSDSERISFLFYSWFIVCTNLVNVCVFHFWCCLKMCWTKTHSWLWTSEPFEDTHLWYYHLSPMKSGVSEYSTNLTVQFRWSCIQKINIYVSMLSMYRFQLSWCHNGLLNYHIIQVPNCFKVKIVQPDIRLNLLLLLIGWTMNHPLLDSKWICCTGCKGRNIPDYIPGILQTSLGTHLTPCWTILFC